MHTKFHTKSNVLRDHGSIKKGVVLLKRQLLFGYDKSIQATEYIDFYNFERISLKNGLSQVEIRSKTA